MMTVALTERLFQDEAADGVHAPPGFLGWVAQLVHIHCQRLLAYARKRGLDAEDALDAVQESFVSFFPDVRVAEILRASSRAGPREQRGRRHELNARSNGGTSRAPAGYSTANRRVNMAG
jgi:uncharacterized protein CbrC (UPF0167 family)